MLKNFYLNGNEKTKEIILSINKRLSCGEISLLSPIDAVLSEEGDVEDETNF
jgi:hypothetical protein